MKRSLAAFLSLVAFQAATCAQVSPKLFDGLEWRSIGPFRGGRAVAVSGVPGGGSTFYFGAVDGGVWKTSDAGSVWKPIFDGQSAASVGALDVAPSDPNIIYVGTGESDIRSDLASGDGVYKSTDGGRSWRNIGLADSRQISRIVVNPSDAGTVFVAALGHAYGPNEQRGVFRSSDGGRTWQRVLYINPQIGAADLALSNDRPRILFAAMWEAHRAPWSAYAPLAGPGSGLYRSTDNGSTWKQITGNGFPQGNLGRIGVAIARGTEGRRVYAVIEADSNKAGLYRSDDGGDSWVRVNSDPRLTSRGWYFNCITVDPNDPDTVYVPNVAFYKLSQGGTALTIVRGAPGGDDYHQLWIDPANSAHMVLGTDQGTAVSVNGGETWSTWYNQPTAQFYHVATDNAVPYNVYGAQQDSGTAATPSRTDHGGLDLRDWFSVGGSESGYIVPDPKNPNIFYVSGTYGELARFDRRTMQSQNIAPWPMTGGIGTEIDKWKYRDPWTPVLAFSPLQANTLFFGTQFVMRTLDGGLHWQTISPDLTRLEPQRSDSTEPVSVANARERGYGVIYTIAPSPLDGRQIWVGSDTGLIHLTRDGGRSWSDVTPPGLSAWSKISLIEASHLSAGEAWAAVDRHRLDDMRPYLFRTRDFGKTWQPIVRGIASNAFLRAIREDPKRKGLLFAATEFGVYVSFDDGDEWLPLQLNLPVTSVRDLVVHDNDLVIGTHGRAFWILDDITPLRQIDPAAPAVSARLYKPARAYRVTNDSFPGTPLPVDEPQAKNPPRGVYIDYYLHESAISEVTLEILDTQGRAVRRFSSREQAPKPPRNAPIALHWFPKPKMLSTEAGTHRFVWDLRYGRSGAETAGDNDDADEDQWVGPLVLPGLYKVRLTVDGKTFSQPLQVSMDPRSHATAAELAAQFQWARRTFEDMIAAKKSVAEITGLQNGLAKAKSHIAGRVAPALVQINTADDKLSQILTGDHDSPDQGLEFANRALTAALTSLESADRTPPSQVIALYLQASRTLKARLADWTAFKHSTLPALNGQLRSAGLPAIQISELEQEAEDSLAR
ncbi:MAG TPA: hypothetical protein VH601_02345 [Bryobacteraceae bacterium]|jgi:photosystem II stability/assembly factor-like uncharacterized protein